MQPSGFSNRSGVDLNIHLSRTIHLILQTRRMPSCSAHALVILHWLPQHRGYVSSPLITPVEEWWLFHSLLLAPSIVVRAAVGASCGAHSG